MRSPAHWARDCELHFRGTMRRAILYVYILRSLVDRSRYYTGSSANWKARVAAHNSGLCQSTATGRPWEVDVVVRFADERRALAFERYLKTGSGWAFAKRHLR